MSLCAVIGNGPRTGTSFVMQRLHEAGLPVVWDKSLNIPGADYDILPKDVFHVEQGIVKIWPPILWHLRLDRAVVLRRNYDDQLRSAKAQLEREEAADVIMDKGELTVEEALKIHTRSLGHWLLAHRHTPVLEVRTEELDMRIDEIVDWMAQAFQRRVA